MLRAQLENEERAFGRSGPTHPQTHLSLSNFPTRASTSFGIGTAPEFYLGGSELHQTSPFGRTTCLCFVKCELYSLKGTFFFTKKMTSNYNQRGSFPQGASLIAQSVRIRLQCRRPGFNSWIRKIPWRREWQPTPVFFPGESQGQRSLAGYTALGFARVRHDLATQPPHSKEGVSILRNTFGLLYPACNVNNTL